MENVQILNDSTRRVLLADFLDDVEDITKYIFQSFIFSPTDVLVSCL